VFLNAFVKEHENGKKIKQGEEVRTCLKPSWILHLLYLKLKHRKMKMLKLSHNNLEA
jgi:hypothetical protein